MRILIVGGGVAGLTLAALLYQRGLAPTVIEKVKAYGDAGYVLSLYPLGNRVLHGLGLFGRFEEASVQLAKYVVHNGEGQHLKTFDVATWLKPYGQARTLMRADLLDVLRGFGSGFPIKMGCTANEFEQTEDEVHVTFSDSSQASYDLVVGADGIRSRVRGLLFGDVPLRHTGWTGLGWWFDPGKVPHERVEEYWGAGRFFGVYPARDRVACYAALPFPEAEGESVQARREWLREAFSDSGSERIRSILDRLDEVGSVDPTALADLDLPRWSRGRVLLIGDASAAFLPTAGVGASMAMESAAVLADELSRTTARRIPNAIDLFVKRRRERVDAIQKESRRVLRLMAVRSPLLASARNLAMRFADEQRMFRSISSRLKQPI